MGILQEEPRGLYWPQGFDAKTENELFRGYKPIIRPVQALEKKGLIKNQSLINWPIIN
jgi:hypothetical protein